jgi:hypothetical protein
MARAIKAPASLKRELAMKNLMSAPLAERQIRVRAANSAIARFHASRSAMIAAWRAWLATRPSVADVRVELDGTLSALEQLGTLEGAGA